MRQDYDRAKALLLCCLRLFQRLRNEAGVAACEQGLVAVASATCRRSFRAPNGDPYTLDLSGLGAKFAVGIGL